MPMRDQPDGVRRVPRGSERPPREYDIYVDGELAGVMERLPKGEWRGRIDGVWPQKFGPRKGAFIDGTKWMAEQHRAGKARAEQAAVTEAAQVQRVPLSPAAANPFNAGMQFGTGLDPFMGDPFADPLA